MLKETRHGEKERKKKKKKTIEGDKADMTRTGSKARLEGGER